MDPLLGKIIWNIPVCCDLQACFPILYTNPIGNIWWKNLESPNDLLFIFLQSHELEYFMVMKNSKCVLILHSVYVF